jgi:alkanesulfonate monooxygenase SsuD/methylene tetrahydromethanopterin reductase-like flavin-dependent oxidoreductase (luciferase family)
MHRDGYADPARQLITDLVEAEAAGFDFSVVSDHSFVARV